MRLVLNLERIRELREIDGDGSMNILKELIGLFQLSGRKNIKDILIHFEVKNFIEVKRSAHNLRSSCLNLGVLELGLIAERIEYFDFDRTASEKVALEVLILEEQFEIALQELRNTLN